MSSIYVFDILCPSRVINAPEPGQHLLLSVAASHPELGDYFIARLKAERDTKALPLPNEIASWECLWKYGFQPQRVALWIYWQALKLLWKGVPFYSPPNLEERKSELIDSARHLPKFASSGCVFDWRPAESWPWATPETT